MCGPKPPTIYPDPFAEPPSFYPCPFEVRTKSTGTRSFTVNIMTWEIGISNVRGITTILHVIVWRFLLHIVWFHYVVWKRGYSFAFLMAIFMLISIMSLMCVKLIDKWIHAGSCGIIFNMGCKYLLSRPGGEARHRGWAFRLSVRPSVCCPPGKSFRLRCLMYVWNTFRGHIKLQKHFRSTAWRSNIDIMIDADGKKIF